MQTSDQILLERWRAGGDAAAFREITVRYANLVYSAAKRVLKDATEAEDVAQECFEALATRREDAPTYLGSWLHTVATNRALKHMESVQRRRAREVRAAADGPAYTRTVWDDLYEHVDAAIAELPEDLRAALVGHFLEGQGKADLARALGVSRPTVHYRIDKGLEQVRRALRRRGVTASASAFATAMAAQASEAAPAGLLAALGKLAVGGMPMAFAPMPSSVGASLLGSIVMKKAIIAGSCAIAIIGGIGLAVRSPSGPSTPTEVVPLSNSAQPIVEENTASADEPEPAVVPVYIKNSPALPAPSVNAFAARGLNAPVDYGDLEIIGRVETVHGEPIERVTVVPFGIVSRWQPITDREGRFRIPVHAGDLLQLTLYHFLYSQKKVSGLEPGKEEIVIVMEDRVAVSGRVVDADNGMAVPRFKITSQTGISQSISRSSISDVQEVNDSRGIFELDGVETGDSTLVVESDGYSASFTSLTVATSEPVRDVVIEIGQGVVVEGRVTDAEEKPAVSVHVSTRAAGASPWADAALTDATGAFTLIGLRGDEEALYVVDTIQGSGRAILAWNGATRLRGVDIVLEKIATSKADVIVTAGGTPIENCSVLASGLGEMQMQMRSAKSGKDGRATLEGLTPGLWKVGAFYPGSRPTSRSYNQTMEIQVGTPVQVHLELPSASGVLKGQVHSGDQYPVGGFLNIDIKVGVGKQTEVVELKADGKFTFESVVGGEGVVGVSADFADGSRWRSVPVQIAEGETQHLDIDFAEAGSIQGTIANPPDFERGNVWVLRGEREIVEASREVLDVLQPDKEANGAIAADGSYVVEGIAPGQYTALAIIYSELGASEPTHFDAAIVDVADGEAAIVDFDLDD